MRAPAEISRLTDSLMAVAERHRAGRPLFAFVSDAQDDIESRVPPGCVLGSEESFWAALQGPIRATLRDRNAHCAGLLLPVELVDGVPSPCFPSIADGLALLAAQRMDGGAVSLAYYAELDRPELHWVEIHDKAQWLLTPLRGFVTEKALELGESAPTPS